MEDIFGNDLGNISPQSYGKPLGPQSVDQRISKMVNDNKEYRLPLYGSGAPSISPRFIGDTYYDTTNQIIYSAYGKTVSDWKRGDTGVKAGNFRWRASVTLNAGRVHASQFICPVDCVVTQAIMETNSTGALNFKMAIYDDVARAPNNLLGQTNEVSVDAADDFKQFAATFTSSISLSANTYYWIAYHGDTAGVFSMSHAASVNGVYLTQAYANGFPDPYGAPTDSTDSTLYFFIV